jgi:hypothetical protein
MSFYVIFEYQREERSVVNGVEGLRVEGKYAGIIS